MHPDIKPDTVLGKSRRKTTISQPRPRPLALPPPAEVRDTNVSSAMPSVADDIQRVNSKPIVMQNRDDGRGVDHLDDIYHSAMMLSIGEPVQLVNDMGISILGAQSWFAHPLYTRHTVYDF